LQGATQTSFNQGGSTTAKDAFVSKLSGNSLQFSTYLGGAADDVGNGIGLDGQNNFYVTGTASSTNFPTQSPYQGSNAGGQDVFLSKYWAKGSPPVFTGISNDTGSSGSDQITSGQTQTLSGTADKSSTVTITRVGTGVIGTATADASTGVWSFN